MPKSGLTSPSPPRRPSADVSPSRSGSRSIKSSSERRRRSSSASIHRSRRRLSHQSSRRDDSYRPRDERSRGRSSRDHRHRRHGHDDKELSKRSSSQSVDYETRGSRRRRSRGKDSDGDGKDDDSDSQRRRRRRERSRSDSRSRRRRRLSSRSPRRGDVSKTFSSIPPSIPTSVPVLLSTLPVTIGGIPVPVNAMPAEDRRSRRLYIGNLPPGVMEAAIVQFFNGALVAAQGVDYNQAAITGALPVLKAEVSPGSGRQGFIEHRYCFLEFKTAADADLCLKLDGITFNGFSLKIGRPKDYQPPIKVADPSSAGAMTAAATAAVAALHHQQTSDGRVHFSDIPDSMTEAEIQALVSQFGPLKSFSLAKDPVTNRSLGTGTLEYIDPAKADLAVKTLTGMRIGDKQIKFTKLVATLEGGLGALGTLGGSTCVTVLPTSMTYKIFTNAIIGAQVKASKHTGALPSPVVQLLNAVFSEDLIKDDEYAEIIEEMKSEASQFGQLEEVVIPRPPPDLSYKEGVGKVFLHFADVTAARKAQMELNGRRYEQRRIVCAAFYPLDKFKEGKYSLL